ncbi:ROK family protein [Falsibacillus albus]|uniref:fructokinase n=1 Tax=Falsibacillus albus TaxID=2478915 RepID=A0A3L7JXQ3_9BACI|nr:ROK family protein [Falsibacillus albus]RLQ94899.1 ROK family protein [Falsibacillus albus]
MSEVLVGGIEAGGTKFVCAVGRTDGTIEERMVIPTLHPEETIPKVFEFFKKHEISALGIGSFGPVDINKDSPTYGSITTTPKPGWGNYPFVAVMKEALDVPVGFQTDVNGAALGEMAFGAAKGLDSCLYLTVGTGIGGGAVMSGEIVQGLSHPEMGHILVKRHPEDAYQGACPYHRDCLEGMASGPAIEKRWGKKGAELSGEKEVWELEAYYLAQALVNYILILSPKKIILGGGVMKQPQLFPLVRKNVQTLLNNYVNVSEVAENIENYIVSPGLGDNAGIVGALVLAGKA